MEYSAKQGMMIGPWGGDDGFYWDDGVYSTIRQLEIAHGAGIYSIKIEYEVKGKSIWSEKHGGLGGSKFDKVRLEYPNEHLTSLRGHFGSLQERGPTLIRSLTFETNKRVYGPFGVEEGTHFTSNKMQGKIVGFVGKYGWYLNSIGVYIEPLKHVTSYFNPLNNSPVISNSMYLPRHGEFSQEPKNIEYSTMHGSLGKNFDLIVAVRRRDEARKSQPVFSQIPHDEPKINEVVAAPVPSIAATVPSIDEKVAHLTKGVVKSVTWGGHGGGLFDDGVYDGIRQINVYRNVAINSIRVCYDKDQEPVWGSKHGGMGSIWSDKIVFDYPAEKLSHISGYYGPTMIMGPNAIKSLTFHTTKGLKFGPYGEEEGEYFSTKSNEGSVVLGFHGRKGLFVDAIGVHMIQGKVYSGPSSSNKETKPQTNNNYEWSRGGRRLQLHPESPAPYETGPWGGEGGKAWDDGVFSGIKQIIVTKTTDAICCIEIEYDRSGKSVWSVKHGGVGGQTANQVKLEYPNEVLTCISGYYGPMKKEQGTNVILSLTFHTSRRKYGPFGEELGTYFSSGTTEGKVVGFHGRSGLYLDAIGVHMPHWLGNQKGGKGSSLMKKIFY